MGLHAAGVVVVVGVGGQVGGCVVAPPRVQQRTWGRLVCTCVSVCWGVSALLFEYLREVLDEIPYETCTDVFNFCFPTVPEAGAKLGLHASEAGIK